MFYAVEWDNIVRQILVLSVELHRISLLFKVSQKAFWHEQRWNEPLLQIFEASESDVLPEKLLDLLHLDAQQANVLDVSITLQLELIDLLLEVVALLALVMSLEHHSLTQNLLILLLRHLLAQRLTGVRHFRRFIFRLRGCSHLLHRF